MNNFRAAESLWQEWDGLDFPDHLDDPVIYFTLGHVGPDHTFAFSALASAIQRSGIVDTLYQARQLLEEALVTNGELVREKDAREYSFRPLSWNIPEDNIEDVSPATWVEFQIDNHE